jgi:hypothetical protein
VVLTITALVLGCIGLPYLALQQDSVVAVTSTSIVDTKQAGKTAILSLVAPVGKFGPTQTQTLPIRIDSGGSLVSAVNLKILFPPDRVRVTDVNFSNSFCTISPVFSINNTLGSVTLSCTSNSPGLTGQLGTVASLITSPLQPGDASFQFDQVSSSVIARVTNKDVLSYTVDKTISYGENPGNRLVVTSTTHPLGMSCSFKSTTELAWLKQEGASTFEYGWSEDPNQEPTTPTSSTTISLPTKPGATQFFSIRAVNDKGVKGSVTRYRVASC